MLEQAFYCIPLPEEKKHKGTNQEITAWIKLDLNFTSSHFGVSTFCSGKYNVENRWIDGFEMEGHFFCWGWHQRKAMFSCQTKGFVHIVQFVERNSSVLVKKPCHASPQKRLNGVYLSDSISFIKRDKSVNQSVVLRQRLDFILTFLFFWRPVFRYWNQRG